MVSLSVSKSKHLYFNKSYFFSENNQNYAIEKGDVETKLYYN